MNTTDESRYSGNMEVKRSKSSPSDRSVASKLAAWRMSARSLPTRDRSPAAAWSFTKLDLQRGPAPFGEVPVMSVSYDLLERQVRELLAGESDFIANAANFASLVYHELPRLNWAGFYFSNASDGD